MFASLRQMLGPVRQGAVNPARVGRQATVSRMPWVTRAAWYSGEAMQGHESLCKESSGHTRSNKSGSEGNLRIMPADLFLVRHATPDWNRTDLRYDIPLAPTYRSGTQRSPLARRISPNTTHTASLPARWTAPRDCRSRFRRHPNPGHYRRGPHGVGARRTGVRSPRTHDPPDG